MTELAHWGAIVPLGALLVFAREAPPLYWLVALGLSASWFVDALAIVGQGTWAVSYVLPVVQLGLLSVAFGRSYAVPLLLLAVGAEVVLVGVAEPEVWVTLVGSAAVLWWSRGTALEHTMLVYCGLGTALYVIMATDLAGDGFMSTWYAYQSARLFAFALFLRAITQAPVGRAA